MRPASDLENTILKYRNALMEWHEDEMHAAHGDGETPGEGRGNGAGTREKKAGGGRAGSSFKVWLRSGTRGPVRWARYALVVSATGVIRCISDSVEALTAEGPTVLGAICKPPSSSEPDRNRDGVGSGCSGNGAASPRVSGILQRRLSPLGREEARERPLPMLDVKSEADVCSMDELPQSEVLAGERRRARDGTPACRMPMPPRVPLCLVSPCVSSL